MNAAAAPRAARFWDRLAERYAKMPLRDPEGYERRLAMTRAHLSPDATVLEVGCGTGTTALNHAPHAGNIRAVDFSGKMIEIACPKAAEAGVENVDFQQCSVEDLGAAPESFDMVMAHSLLHLLPDRRAALARFHALLKPGGTFVSSTYCIAGAPPHVRALLRVAGLAGVLPRMTFLEAGALKAELADAGFEIEEDWHPGPLKPLFIVARKLNR
ncbi:ubiquinone/menaquinone biosynthesis C-methylase UbiE [Rhodovulum iodosum]|uniref:Ubiquinone/menaquinone biosynthesis C-methylase UbiE n=1 Tax=Rhodovulum iodosum TaxID=68291 RepID=A0ABV3XRQ4_9RHOB|nr:class I SAM-dependent methyltransferase [Rhodovulum robiginosum]RSK30355.1 class I SAM-dependent methyltransferase [Rhodovulum robiginosum]